MVGIGVGGGSRRSGEEEAGGLGRRQHHPLVAARLVTGGVCVCVCVCGVYWSLIPQVVVAALGMNGHGIEYHWQ